LDIALGENCMQHRKCNRLQGYDYSKAGYYFITIRAMDKCLGLIENDSVSLNKYGDIVFRCWLSLFKKNKFLEQDEFIIMPDHLHSILIINNTSGDAVSSSLSTLIGTFKSASSRKIHSAGLISFRWQRSFYDRIIRNEKELFQIRNYIRYNAQKDIK
jgi:putative transposase